MKTILIDAVHAFIIKDKEGNFGIFKEMYRMLEEFPNKKIILTGANDEQLKKFGLDQAPYDIFTLKHNPEKSDSEYYKQMLKRFNLKSRDVVYFEHDIDAIASAKSIGIKTYYWDSEKQPLKELNDFLRHNA